MDCPQKNKYISKNSKSFSTVEISEIEQTYGIGSITGSKAKDTICFSQQTQADKSCVDSIDFINVKSSKSIDGDNFSGLIGLGPGGSGDEISSFLSQVQKKTSLSQSKSSLPINSVFSLYLANDKDGKLIFGGYDLNKYAKDGLKDSDVFWTTQDKFENQFWSVQMS